MESLNMCPLVSGVFHLVSSGFNHVVACVGLSILLKAEYYSVVCTDHVWFTHSPVDRLSSVFSGAQVSVRIPAFMPLGTCLGVELLGHKVTLCPAF